MFDTDLMAFNRQLERESKEEKDHRDWANEDNETR